MTGTDTRILLRAAVPLAEVMNFSGRQHWFFQEQRLHGPGRLVDIYTWLTPDLQTVVHYVVDDIRDQHYFVIEGPDAEQADASVSANFPTYSVEEIRQRVREAHDPDDRIEAIQRLGTVTSREPNGTDLALFEAFLADPDPAIRSAAVVVVGYVTWPALQAQLEEMQAHDPDMSVREAAAKMLNAMERTCSSSHCWPRSWQSHPYGQDLLATLRDRTTPDAGSEACTAGRPCR